MEAEADSTRLVRALQRAKENGKKSLIRSTDHHVSLAFGTSAVRSALVEDEEDDQNFDIDIERKGREDELDDPSPIQRTVTGEKHTVTLTSWKTQEFAYRKTSKVGYGDDDELPTLARGLFTCPDSIGGHRIVVRGYDKFFNEGEMPWTKPDAIAAYSRPPYELSFKENGCIIFVAALSEHQLIVTSKHSMGANESHTISHAQKGEEWLERHLQTVSKTKRQLAEQLWKQNETAVAELCDDEFEEHVLAYPPERTGLHLHGLNANTPQFQTRSMGEVEMFARKWGFLPTRYHIVNSIDEVNEFTQRVAETGRWEGTAIEGFVVRTRIPTEQDIASKSVRHVIAPPYSKGQNWFYKVKFDEPYLMYRDWRELTRKMLSDKQAFDKTVPALKQAQRAEPPQIRKKRPETRLFVEWCMNMLYGSEDGTVAAQPKLFEKLQQNQGIIRLRDTFIEYMESPEGQKKLNKTQGLTINNAQDKKGPRRDCLYTKTLIVPVAIPGCGKTALAVALTHLFPCFSHTQSDDVQTKKTGPTFLRNIANKLNQHDVVFADRNNHLMKHRKEIIKCVIDWENASSVEAAKQKQSKKDKGQQSKEVVHSNRHVRLVAVVWPIEDLPLNSVHHLCSDRLVLRGENHQSLRVESGKEHEDVLWQFLQTRETFQGDDGKKDEQSDYAFDHVIKMDIHSTLDQMIKKAAEQLASILEQPCPSNERVSEAIEWAKQYRVSLKKDAKSVIGPAARYYGLSLEVDLATILQHLLSDHKEAKAALDRLIKAKRVTSRPHVTLVHSSELNVDDKRSEEQKQAQKRWDAYSSLYQQSRMAVLFDLEADCLAWNERAMSVGICRVTSAQCTQVEELQENDWRPHVTVGTFSEDIRPYEGRKVLCEADSGASTVSCIHFKHHLHIQGRLQGLR